MTCPVTIRGIQYVTPHFCLTGKHGLVHMMTTKRELKERKLRFTFNFLLFEMSELCFSPQETILRRHSLFVKSEVTAKW
jgi:hypothetical protein